MYPESEMIISELMIPVCSKLIGITSITPPIIEFKSDKLVDIGEFT
jgi:hypothetical protein